MPWTCDCGTSHPDDAGACAVCGGRKSSWTVVPDRTRGLVLTVGRFEVHVGVGAEHVEDLVGVEWTPAEVGPVLPAGALRDALAAGRRPAPAHLLRVRVLPGRPREATVDVAIEFAQAAVETVKLARGERAVGADGSFDVVLALVRDDGTGLADLERPDLAIVDVTEGAGHAPSVSISSLRRPAVELPLRPVARTVDLALVDDVHFGTDRVVLLPLGPDMPKKDEAPAPGALAVIKAVLEACDVLPGKRVLVVGHTDTSGSKAHNLELSRERAKNVWLYLTGQRDAWAAHCLEHDAIDDLKRALRWVARTFAWDTEPGSVDGSWTEKARVARDELRERYNAEHGGTLARGVKQSAADWAALYDLYDRALGELLGVDAAGLAAHRARVQLMEPAFVGLGERWPLGSTRDGQRVAADRRVELLLFDEGDLPAPDDDGTSIYGPDGFRRVPLPTDLGELIGLCVTGDDAVCVGKWIELRATTRRPVEGALSWTTETETARLSVEAGASTWFSGEREATQAPVSCSLTTPLGRTYKAAHPLRVTPVSYEVAFHLAPGEALPFEPRAVLRALDGDPLRIEVALGDPERTTRTTLGKHELHVVRFDGVLPGRRYACHVVGQDGALERCLFAQRTINADTSPTAKKEGA